jgi:hypothetical protein
VEPAKAAIDAILAQAREGRRNAADYVDSSLLEELKAAGFFEAMARKYPGR